MEFNLLAQLETKPTPQKTQEVQIILPGNIEVAIVDRRDEGYDGDALRRRLQQFQRIEKLKSPEDEEEEEEEEEEDEEEEEEEEEPSVAPSGAPSSAAAAPSSAPSGAAAAAAAAASEEEEELASFPSLSSDEDVAAAAASDDEEEEEIRLDIPINSKGTTLESRIPIKSPKRIHKKPSYFMNNRKKFIEFITTLLLPYRQELIADESNISCEDRGGDFSLLTHQKLVRDYINMYTPVSWIIAIPWFRIR